MERSVVRPHARRAVLAALGVAALAACDDGPAGLRSDAPEGTLRRLVVADQAEARLRVVEVGDGRVAETVTIGAPVTYLLSGASGRYALAVQRDANEVRVLDGGLYEDPANRDRLFRRAPALLAWGMPGALPTHGGVHGHWMGAFYDGTGEVRVFDERALFAGTPPVTTVASGRAHHGAFVAMGDAVLVSTPNPDPAATSTLPVGVDVYSMAGQRLQRFDGCPGLHGEAANRDATAWGCTDGILVVRRSGGQWTSLKAPYTGVFAGARSGTLFGHEAVPYLVAHFGGGRPAARLDPATGALTPITLPGRLPASTGYVFTEDGRHLLALSPSGDLHVLDAATLSLRGVVAGAGVALPDPVPGGTRQSRVVGGAHFAYVSNPATGEVAEVELATLRVTRRMAVGGAPGQMALLGTDRTGHSVVE